MVKKIFIKVIVVLIIATNTTCITKRFPFNISELTYKGQLIHSNQFRIDGFYYRIFEDVPNRVDIKYFFLDGTYCEFDVEYTNFLKLPDGGFVEIPNKIRELPYCWGAYIIEDDMLKVQVYESWRGFSPFRVMREYYKIVNNTQIHWFQRITSTNQKIDFDITYHFRPTSSKPDSTSVLMKYKRNPPVF